MTVRTQGKALTTIAAALVSVAVIDQGCALTNEPSDAAFILGVLIVAATVLAVPSMLAWMWRRNA